MVVCSEMRTYTDQTTGIALWPVAMGPKVLWGSLCLVSIGGHTMADMIRELKSIH